jgi:hypothetical protein
MNAGRCCYSTPPLLLRRRGARLIHCYAAAVMDAPTAVLR